MRTEWVVLADANRARVFARIGNGGWQDVRTFSRVREDATDNGREVRLPEGLRKLDKVVNGNGHAATDDFIERLAGELRTARKRGDFDALVLVAPLAVLEPLQDALDTATRRTLISTATDDALIGLPLREARKQLARRF